MAIFTEKGQGGPESPGALSIIGPGTRVAGDITADGVVKIEGTVVGTIRAGRQVLVAKGGEVEGDIVTREAIIGGEVRGTVLAEERAEIQPSSVVHGDVTTRRLLVHEGGEVNGVLRMGETEAATPQERAAAAPEASSPSLY
jgi:cytoskeletal protein CcmA (bactofilin family)